MSEMRNTTVNVTEGLDLAICQSKEDEMPLEERLMRFRRAYPKGRLIQRVVHLNDKLAIMEARLYLGAGGEDSYVSNCFGMAVRNTDDRTGEFIHRAENIAVNHALFNAGFGLKCITEMPEEETEKRSVTKNKRKTEKGAAVSETPQNTAEVRGEKPGESEIQERDTSASKEDSAGSEDTPVQGFVTSITDAGDTESVERAMASMTLQEAVKVTVEVGAAKGKTIGQIAKEDPRQLFWFRDSYKGPDSRLRAAAALLLREAGAEKLEDSEAKAA